MQDISFNKNSKWFELGESLAVLYVNASWSSQAASSSVSDSVSSLHGGAWAVGRPVSVHCLVMHGFVCVSTYVSGNWASVASVACGHDGVSAAALAWLQGVMVHLCMAMNKR